MKKDKTRRKSNRTLEPTRSVERSAKLEIAEVLAVFIGSFISKKQIQNKTAADEDMKDEKHR